MRVAKANIFSRSAGTFQVSPFYSGKKGRKFAVKAGPGCGSQAGCVEVMKKLLSFMRKAVVEMCSGSTYFRCQLK